MNRRLTLLALYESDPIPVERIAPDLFGLSYSKAREKIKAGDWPADLPPFQLVDSQKAPWFVSVDALARYIDQRERAARENRERLLHDLLQGQRSPRNHAA